MPGGPSGARSPSHGASGLPKVAATRSRSTDAASVRLSCTSPAISVDERPMTLAPAISTFRPALSAMEIARPLNELHRSGDGERALHEAAPGGHRRAPAH